MKKKRVNYVMGVVLLVGAIHTATPNSSSNTSAASKPQVIAMAQNFDVQASSVRNIRAATSYSRDEFPTGVSRVKVIRYSTPSASPQLNIAQIDAVMNTVRAKYETWSGGKWTFSHVIEEATVPTFNCSGIIGLEDKDKSNFDHIVEYGPVEASTCGFSGLASLGGRWMLITNTGFTMSVVAHELGHNLGLSHARSVTCPTQLTPWSECSYLEYGDVIGVMGWGYETLGGLGTAISDWHDPARIQVGVNGDIEIGDSPSALVLPDPAGKGEYWVEYVRKANVTRINADQVVVRRVLFESVRHSGSDIIDRVAGSTYTMDGGFFAGDTFTDPTGTLNVQVISLGATARLRVSGATRPVVSVWNTELRDAQTNEGLLIVNMPTKTSHTQALELKIWRSDGTTSVRRLRPSSAWESISNLKQVVAIQLTARELDGISAGNTYVIRKNSWVPSPASAVAISNGARISLPSPSKYQRMSVTCGGGRSKRVFTKLQSTMTITGIGKAQDCFATFETLSGDVVTSTESVVLPRNKNKNWVSVNAHLVGDEDNYRTRLEVSRGCIRCPRATIAIERWNGDKWVRVRTTSSTRSYWSWNSKTIAPLWRIRVNKTTYTPITPDELA